MLLPAPVDARAEAKAVRPKTAGEALAIVAGGGDMPGLVLRAAVEAGWRPVVVAVGDGIDRSFEGVETIPCRWSHIGDMLADLRRRGIGKVVSCGTISARPDFHSLRPSLRTLALLPAVLKALRGGDDSTLRSIERIVRRYGLTVLAVQDVAPELLAPAGEMTGRPPDEAAERALARAIEASRALGSLDAGQAAVASQDRVIALECIEGTREMLARVADLRARGRIGRRERCVLFKGVKPGQDLRFDLPSIGRATIDEAERAGLAGIGLSAHHALVIGIDDVIAAARQAGLFVIGVPPGEPTGGGC